MGRTRTLARGLLAACLLCALLALTISATLPAAQAAPAKRGAQAPLKLPATHVVISELRSLGPGGPTDEFIELFNPTGATIPLNGWTLWRSGDCDGGKTSFFTFGAVSLEPGQHYLIAGVGYTGIVAPDPPPPLTSIGLADEGGIALLRGSLVTDPIEDQVGMCNGTTWVEGAPLTPLSGTLDQVYERKSYGGVFGCTDTDHNASDFSLIVPSVPHNTVSTKTPCPAPTPTPSPTNTRVPTSTPLPTLAPTKTPKPPPGCTTPAKYPVRRVLINEVGWAGTDAYHSDLWLELWNPDPRCPIKLQDWYLKGDSGWTVNFTSADGSIGPGDYYVITHYFDAFQNLKPDKFDSGLSLDYSGEVVYLYGSHKELVDTANCNSTDTSHCAGGSWPAGQYSPHAVSMERRGNLVDNSEAWMTYDGSFDPGSGTLDAGTHRVRGTPRQKNWAFDRAAPVPTATERVRKPTAIPPTPFAHMVINEFLPRAGTDWNQDGSVDVYDEFIELKNLGPIDVDLSDWILDNGPNTSSSPYRLPSQTLKPGERALFYGLKTHILLPDSGGLVRLVNPDGVIFDARGYGPVAAPDQSTCRIPDGFYWRLGCFPTPGLENSLRGVSAAPPPVAALKPPPCLLADSVPEPFREAECAPFGADIWNGQYWDDQAGQSEIPVQDIYSKWWTIIK